jgi:hypothetical protein
MKSNIQIIIASLQAGNTIKISLRDYLLVEREAEKKGFKISVLRRDKSEVVIRKQ